jgi:hypothetical protein
MSKIFTGIALAISMSVAGSALAAESAMPKSWAGPIGDAFYSDTGAMTMRSEDEIKANWAKMTPEQQAQAHEDCKVWAASPKTGGDSERTGGEGMSKVCDWVNAM